MSEDDWTFPIFLRVSSTHYYLPAIHQWQLNTFTLVALLRLKFWITNARDLAPRIVRACTHCIRYRPVLLHQVMGQLPKARLAISKQVQQMRC